MFKKSVWKNKNPYQDEEYGQSATIVHPFFSVNDTYEGTIEEAGWYYAVVSSRDPFRDPVKVTTKTTLFNPGNAKHLSVDVKKITLFNIHILKLFVYFVILFVYLFYLYIYYYVFYYY